MGFQTPYMQIIRIKCSDKKVENGNSRCSGGTTSY